MPGAITRARHVLGMTDQAGFCAQTLHQPAAGTLWPAKILQPAVASVAVPWYCAQVLHFWLGLKVGFAAALTLLPSGA